MFYRIWKVMGKSYELLKTLKALEAYQRSVGEPSKTDTNVLLATIGYQNYKLYLTFWSSESSSRDVRLKFRS